MKVDSGLPVLPVPEPAPPTDRPDPPVVIAQGIKLATCVRQGTKTIHLRIGSQWLCAFCRRLP